MHNTANYKTCSDIVCCSYDCSCTCCDCGCCCVSSCSFATTAVSAVVILVFGVIFLFFISSFLFFFCFFFFFLLFVFIAIWIFCRLFWCFFGWLCLFYDALILLVGTWLGSFDEVLESGCFWRAPTTADLVLSGTSVSRPQSRYTVSRIECRIKFPQNQRCRAKIALHPRVAPFSGPPCRTFLSFAAGRGPRGVSRWAGGGYRSTFGFRKRIALQGGVATTVTPIALLCADKIWCFFSW